MEMDICKKLHSLRATLSDKGNTINIQTHSGDNVEIIVISRGHSVFSMDATISQLQQMVNRLADWERKEVEPDADQVL